MYHVVQVGMNSEILHQLDALRRVYPGCSNRTAIICALILEANERTNVLQYSEEQPELHPRSSEG